MPSVGINISINHFYADPPIMSLAFGAKINPERIDEGNDVYLECNIKANPKVYKVIWRHNVSSSMSTLDPMAVMAFLCPFSMQLIYTISQGKTVEHKKEEGVIISGESLVLQKVDRTRKGNYTCLASNLEGDSLSNTVDLKIMCKWDNGM